jgi:hypothetical protein
MVAVYTVICFAILARRAWILAGQNSNCLHFIVVDLILVSERANVLLRARPTKIMVIT